MQPKTRKNDSERERWEKEEIITPSSNPPITTIKPQTRALLAPCAHAVDVIRPVGIPVTHLAEDCILQIGPCQHLMSDHFKRFPWVLEPYLYGDQDRLMAALTEKVIGPAEAKAKEQSGR
jgi:hypothetical protein